MSEIFCRILHLYTNGSMGCDSWFSYSGNIPALLPDKFCNVTSKKKFCNVPKWRTHIKGVTRYHIVNLLYNPKVYLLAGTRQDHGPKLSNAIIAELGVSIFQQSDK